MALRWSDIDIARGTMSVARSRCLGVESATKTPKSQRTIKVRPEVVAVLLDAKPLHVGPDDYGFTNSKNGGPINQSEWPKDHWHAALRATGVRPRKFYCIRHSFISIALTRGVNIKWLAEYTGTSVAMIERSYGRFLAESGDIQLDLLGDDGNRTHKTRDLGGRVSGLRRKTQAG